MGKETLRERYERAIQFGRPVFIDRDILGSPGAPAMAETNVSRTWSEMGVFLIGYEYSRWWKESLALRNTAMLADWSWLEKCRITGADSFRFLNYGSVKDLSGMEIGHLRFVPMVNENGKVALQGILFCLSRDEYIFTNIGAMGWLNYLKSITKMDVELEDVTADYTVYGLQGPKSIDILEALTGENFRDLPFSRSRMTKVSDLAVRISRTGVTGEIGYEFMARTDTGRAHEIWRAIREVGKPFRLREMGWRVQTVGHVETGIATGVVDFLTAWPPHYTMRRFIAEDEVACLEWNLSEHLCSPAELGFGHVIDFEHDYLGRDALLREAAAGGPAQRLVGLEWNSEDVGELFAAQFRDGPAPPPPELPKGRFSPLYNKLLKDGEHVGWATSHAYSPTLRRMISLARIRKDLIAPGTDVIVLWGSFSDEPKCQIRARVVKLPFIPQTRKADLMK